MVDFRWQLVGMLIRYVAMRVNFSNVRKKKICFNRSWSLFLRNMREERKRKEGFYCEENIFQRREVIKTFPWEKGKEAEARIAKTPISSRSSNEENSNNGWHEFERGRKSVTFPRNKRHDWMIRAGGFIAVIVKQKRMVHMTFFLLRRKIMFVMLL